MNAALKPRVDIAAVATAALLAFGALASSTDALAAGDPVAMGTLRIEPAGSFKRQLSRSHVHMKAGSFAVGTGSIDPTTGFGSLRLRGSVIFRHGKKRLRFPDLKAMLRPSGGILKSGHTRMLALQGGVVSRDGFGAEVEGIDLRLPKSFARKLKRGFDLRSLHPGTAGAATVSAQPQTVEILGGTASVAPATGPGSINSKLAAHCVDPVAGVAPIAPGSQPGGPGTTYFYPVAFGTISPTGAAGVIQQSGGIRLANGGSGLPAGCPASNTVTVAMRDLSIDLQAKLVAANASVSGSGSPFGDLEGAISFPIDVDSTLVSADPDALAIAASGTRIELNSVAAMFLNRLFAQPDPADPSMEFAAGDDFGTAGLTVQVR